jgi:NADH-quinone oxidoreductase subunit F
VLARIEAGGGTDTDLTLIEQVCTSMAANSFCPLAVGAAPPVVSAVAEFREEFEAYIRRNPNHSQPQQMRVVYPYSSNPRPMLGTVIPSPSLSDN